MCGCRRKPVAGIKPTLRQPGLNDSAGSGWQVSLWMAAMVNALLGALVTWWLNPRRRARQPVAMTADFAVSGLSLN